MEKRENPNSDSAPEFGGSVRRSQGGKDRSRPIVTQLGFPEGDEEPKPVRLVNTGRKLIQPTPIERLALEAAQGYQDPQTLREARRQARAIQAKIKSKNNGRR